LILITEEPAVDLSIFGYQFMQNALLAAILGGLGCGIIGVWVVLLRIPFIGVAMSHAAFAGAIIALLIGLNPLGLALVASILAAAIIGPLSDRINLDTNLSMGIVFSMLVGIAFLGIGLMRGPRTEALNLLWGNILTLERADLILLAIATEVSLDFTAGCCRQLRAIIFNRMIARMSGIPDKLLFYGTLLISGTTITLNLKTIGGLLIFSLIINPPLAAYQLTYSLVRMLILSALFGIASCLVGLWLSYVFDLPTGAIIILTSGIILIICNLLSPKR